MIRLLAIESARHQMVCQVVAQVAALAQRRQILFVVVGRVVVKMRGRQDDPCGAPDEALRLQTGPGLWVVHGLKLIAEMPVRHPAPFAFSARSLKANAAADFRPIGWI